MTDGDALVGLHVQHNREQMARYDARRRAQPLADVPDIPAERYDPCACGEPRLAHRNTTPHAFVPEENR